MKPVLEKDDAELITLMRKEDDVSGSGGKYSKIIMYLIVVFRLTDRTRVNFD